MVQRNAATDTRFEAGFSDTRFDASHAIPPCRSYKRTASAKVACGRAVGTQLLACARVAAVRLAAPADGGRRRRPRNWPVGHRLRTDRSILHAKSTGTMPRLHTILDRPIFWPLGQFLTGQSRAIGRSSSRSRDVAISCRPAPVVEPAAPAIRERSASADRPRRRRSSSRSATRAAHPSTASCSATRRPTLVTLLTQAKLVRINRATQEVEPWLAESWTRSADGLTLHAQAAAGRHLLRRPARSPPTMCCSRSTAAYDAKVGACSPTR